MNVELDGSVINQVAFEAKKDGVQKIVNTI